MVYSKMIQFHAGKFLLHYLHTLSYTITIELYRSFLKMLILSRHKSFEVIKYAITTMLKL